MSYKMFIDDERFPIGNDWIIARSYDEALDYFEDMGVPSFISFDHDLGDNQPTGYDIVKHLVRSDLNQEGTYIPKDFDFYVHSQNPIGAENIRCELQNYLKFRKKGGRNGR